MVRNKYLLVLVLLTLTLTFPLTTSASVLDFISGDTAGLKWITGTYLNCGTTVLQDKYGNRDFYGKVGIVPVFEKGDHELALDLTMYFDTEGRIRTENWDSASDYVRKILFYRYKTIEDLFSFRLEMVDNLTFGNGVILKDYANSIRYPLFDKKLGATFLWNSGYDDKAMVFIDDVSDPSLFGARGFIQPHDNFIVGATAVTDVNIPTVLGNKDVTALGLDISIPFETKTDINCKFYGEYVNLMNRGDGGHTGILTDFGGFSWKIEYRRFSNDYLPNYFDHLYEMERSFKAARLYKLSGGGRSSGWFNELKLKLNEEFSFRASYEKNYSDYEYPHLSLGINFNETMFNKFKFSFDYDRKNLYYSLTERKDAIYQFNATYDVNGYTHILYNFKHILDENGNPANSINMETRVKF
jgi:hypothetical protein